MGVHAGRKGRRWRNARATCLSISTLCHICGHEGAGEADHDPIPLAELIRLGLDPDDPAHLKPAHGSSSPCETCGRCCNQAKGNKPKSVRVTGSRPW